MLKHDLQAFAELHHVVLSLSDTMDVLRDKIIAHVTSGACSGEDHTGCTSLSEMYSPDGDTEDLRIQLLTAIHPRVKSRPLRRILKANGVSFEQSDRLGALRHRLKAFVTQLRKGKSARYKQARRESAQAVESARLDAVRHNWPEKVPSDLKAKLVQLFREETSVERLRMFTCACCAGHEYTKNRKLMLVDDLPADLLRAPSAWCTPRDVSVETDIDSAYTPPLPILDGVLKDCLLDPTGLVNEEHNGVQQCVAQLCKRCAGFLRCNKLPRLALANRTYVGPVPPQLADLTPVEESMVALCRAKCWILQLKEDDRVQRLPGTQRAMRGHIIIHPQQPEKIETVLPLTMEDAAKPICVVFVGSSKPSKEWLKEKAKPLVVR